MLLHSAGKEITEDTLKKVMTASGVKVDDAKVKAIVSSLQGVNIEEAIKTAAQFSVPQAAPVAAGAEAPKAEKKEEHKKDEEKAEAEAATGLASLFG